MLRNRTSRSGHPGDHVAHSANRTRRRRSHPGQDHFDDDRELGHGLPPLRHRARFPPPHGAGVDRPAAARLEPARGLGPRPVARTPPDQCDAAGDLPDRQRPGVGHRDRAAGRRRRLHREAGPRRRAGGAHQVGHAPRRAAQQRQHHRGRRALRLRSRTSAPHAARGADRAHRPRIRPAGVPVPASRQGGLARDAALPGLARRAERGHAQHRHLREPPAQAPRPAGRQRMAPEGIYQHGYRLVRSSNDDPADAPDAEVG